MRERERGFLPDSANRLMLITPESRSVARMASIYQGANLTSTRHTSGIRASRNPTVKVSPSSYHPQPQPQPQPRPKSADTYDCLGRDLGWRRFDQFLKTQVHSHHPFPKDLLLCNTKTVETQSRIQHIRWGKKGEIIFYSRYGR